MNTSEPWPRCPEAAAFFDTQFRAFAAANPLIEQMAARFLDHAGVRLQNLIDHWTFPVASGLTDVCGELVPVMMV